MLGKNVEGVSVRPVKEEKNNGCKSRSIRRNRRLKGVCHYWHRTDARPRKRRIWDTSPTSPAVSRSSVLT